MAKIHHPDKGGDAEKVTNKPCLWIKRTHVYIYIVQRNQQGLQYLVRPGKAEKI